MHLSLPRFLLSVVPLLAFSFSPVSAAEPKNLLPEGDFETSDNKGGVEGWVFPNADWLKREHKCAIKVENEKGNAFIRMTAEATGPAFIRAEIPLPPEAKSVKVSFRARATDIIPDEEPAWSSAMLGGDFVDTADQSVKALVPKRRIKADAKEWIDVVDTFEVPDGAVKINLQPGLYNTIGTFDVDDFVVTVE